MKGATDVRHVELSENTVNSVRTIEQHIRGVPTTLMAKESVTIYKCTTANCTHQTTNLQASTHHLEYEKLITMYGDRQSNTIQEKIRRNKSYNQNQMPCFIYGCMFDIDMIIKFTASHHNTECVNQMKEHIQKDHSVNVKHPYGCAIQGCTFRAATNTYLVRHIDMRHPKYIIKADQPKATNTTNAIIISSKLHLDSNLIDTPRRCMSIACAYESSNHLDTINHTIYEQIWAKGWFLLDFDKLHIRYMLSAMPYVSMLCPVHECIYYTKNIKDMATHMAEHDDAKNYICPMKYCRKTNIASIHDVKLHVVKYHCAHTDILSNLNAISNSTIKDDSVNLQTSDKGK